MLSERRKQHKMETMKVMSSVVSGYPHSTPLSAKDHTQPDPQELLLHIQENATALLQTQSPA